MKKSYLKNGLKDGVPICLGYFAVSFAFGMVAKEMGLSTFQAVLLSITNVTSAGQFGGLNLIAIGAGYYEVICTQIILNLRYSLMSCSLSQKLDSSAGLGHRLLVAYGVTDEIFGVSVSREEKISPYYSYGLIVISVFGWVLGTFLGVVSGKFLPASISSALGIALYGMFLAIIIPPSKTNKVICGVVIISMIGSVLFSILPYLKEISFGFRIIILTLIIAGIAAWLFPVNEEYKEETAHAA
ncbi:AzlC family ABC transporter permease [Cellulosilyticum ruminicola]|uniref:AzlC family ABC transporter permease n=1 Tax=Cellulosilyticum ruminicola TaxID=425254 RepID=UPI0006CF703A|nr:AzlC family ABC transporter permease [Cellulosilyticum ruminicola]